VTTEDADLHRLALAEVTCRLAHLRNEASALAEHRAFPAMPEDRRAVRLAELQAERAAIQDRYDELVALVPNPEKVRAPDGTLPAERRRANLLEYRERRQEKLGALKAKVGYLDKVLADKSAPKEVRRRARDARATAVNDIDVLNAEPSDQDLRPADMCADAVHLETSHGYVWTSARPAWPCAAWPGQRRVFDKVAHLLFSDMSSGGRDRELTRWQLSLYCGHVVERTAHSSYASYSTAGGGLRECEVCGVDPTFVVDEKPLGPVAPAPPSLPAAPASAPRTRKALERRAAKLEAELAAVRARLQADD
jgi:uncharacterized protein (UPF0147 family)